MCRIPISRFFRDRSIFEALARRVLPELASMFGDVRAWSAGCASGEEPYSLRMAWEESVGPRARLHVTATDVDSGLVERAKIGCFEKSSLRELPREWETKYFDERGCVRTRGIEFLVQDIRSEMPDGPFHLVLCRNLAFTYFEPQLQRELLAQMLDRLMPGGALVVGTHESVPGLRMTERGVVRFTAVCPSPVGKSRP